MNSFKKIGSVFLAMILASLMFASMFACMVSTATTITIDGDFSDWAGVPQYDVAPNPIEPTGDVHGPFNNDLDNTPPVTTKTVDPDSPDGLNGWYVSVITISLSATDDISGVDYTEVNLDGTGWMEGTTVIIGEDGEHTLQYRSVDNAGNVENTHTQNYKLDKTKPVTTKTVGTPKYDSYVTSSTPITLSVTDPASGVDKTYYRINGGSWTEYTGSFTLPGECSHTIDYYSVDKAGNEETIHSQTLYVDNTAPTTIKTVDPDSPDGLNGWYVSVITISLSATDLGLHQSGVALIGYNLGSGWLGTTAESITIRLIEDGEHTVQYRSLDNVDNVENTHTQNYKLDKTRPKADFTHSVSELTVFFDASGSTDATSGIDRYEWDFGDGSTGSGVSPSHTYSAVGTYTVTLKIWDKAGNDGTGTAKATATFFVVSEPPVVTTLVASLAAYIVALLIKGKSSRVKLSWSRRKEDKHLPSFFHFLPGSKAYGVLRLR